MYGETIRLPGEFFAESKGNDAEPAEMVRQLREAFKQIRPTEGTRHGNRKSFIFKDLKTASHVFVRVDHAKSPLQSPYDGPFPVVSRTQKTYVVRLRGKDTHVSIDRLKPTYVLSDSSDRECETEEEPPHPKRDKLTQRNTQVRTRSGIHVRFPDRLQVRW